MSSSQSDLGSPVRWNSILAIAFTAALLYAGTLAYDFVWDDVLLILSRLYMYEWRTLPALIFSDFYSYVEQGPLFYFRPLGIFSFFVDLTLWGQHPAGFHLTNVLLHVAVSIAVYALVRRVTASEIAAVTGALLFAAHPVHSESVAYINGRHDVLATLFILIGLLAYARWRQDGRRAGQYLALASFALALLAKEPGAMMPLLLALYDGALLHDFRTRDAWRRAIGRYAPYGLTFAAYLALRKVSLPAVVNNRDVPWADALTRVLTSLKMAAWYAWLAVLPYPTTVLWKYDVPLDPFPPGLLWWLAMTALAALAVLTVVALRRSPALGFGAAWFWIGLVPVLGGSMVGPGIFMADHNLYLPTVGSCLVAGGLFARLVGRVAHDGGARLRRAPAIGLVLLLLAYGGFTLWRNEDWKDINRLTYRMLQSQPALIPARLVLAQTQIASGEFAAARQNLTIAANLTPNHAIVLAALGFTECHLGNRDAGLGHARQAAELAPDNTSVLEYLAAVYTERGELKAATDVLERSLRKDPHQLRPTLTLALLYRELGDGAAVATVERAIALNNRTHADDLFTERVTAEVYATRDPGRAREAWARYIAALQRLPGRGPGTDAELAHARQELARLGPSPEEKR